MAVADGLLARFRPVAGLTPDQITALARAADAFGNGRIEVTARGSVQVRGLSDDTEEDFRAALDAAGLSARTGVSIEYSPIAGEDPEEILDPLPLAKAIEAACDKALARGPLSPKLSIVLDSGGQVSLGGFKADIRLVAREDGWQMAVGGAFVGVFTEGAVPGAVADILRQLQAIGPRARGSDVASARSSLLRRKPVSISRHPQARLTPMDPGFRRDSEAWVSGLALTGSKTALRIGLPYGQIRAEQLSGLARLMETHGVAEARPAPERTLVLIGASESLAPALHALGFGACAFPLCSGAEASEHGIIHAADLARALAAVAPDLANGSVHLHVSTCAKGCAYAGRPGIILTGDMLGVYGGETQKPFARLDPAAIEAGLVSIAAQIRDDLQSGA